MIILLDVLPDLLPMLGGWWKSIIKCSIVFWTFKFVKQSWTNGNGWLLIVNILKVFGFDMWWQYCKLFDIGNIVMIVLSLWMLCVLMWHFY